MPDYLPDPDHPSQHIDIIELVRRYPDKPPPVNVEDLLRRDLWTCQDALLILCGLAPHNVVHSGLPIGTIGGGIVYLDGIASAQLDALGLQHPRAQAWLPEFMTLAGYTAGQDMNERKPPSEWMAWAKSKGFTPYWLDDAASENREEGTRRAAGRYTLREAAQEIARRGRCDRDDMLRRLSDAWASGTLKVYRPGSKISCTPESAGLHRYYLEVHSSDLNAWLAKNEPHIDWRFPAPTEPAEQAATIAGPLKMGHSTKAKRAQPLDAEIEAAKLEATNPNDQHSVYAVLQRWAEQRKASFIGFVEGEGCKYQTPKGVAFFTLNALRKRMNRAANAR